MPSKRVKAAPWAAAAVRLREAQASSGLSQQKVARKAGIDPATLGDMLRGVRAPRPHTLAAVCRVLGVRAAWVESGEGAARERAPVRTIEWALSALEEPRRYRL